MRVGNNGNTPAVYGSAGAEGAQGAQKTEGQGGTSAIDDVTLDAVPQGKGTAKNKDVETLDKGATQSAEAFGAARASFGEDTPVTPLDVLQALFMLQQTVRKSNQEQQVADLKKQLQSIEGQVVKMRDAAEKEYGAAMAQAWGQIAGGIMQFGFSVAGGVAAGKGGDTAQNWSQVWSGFGQSTSGISTGASSAVAAGRTFDQRQIEADNKALQGEETRAQTQFQQSKDFSDNAKQVRDQIMNLIAQIIDRQYQTTNAINKSV